MLSYAALLLRVSRAQPHTSGRRLTWLSSTSAKHSRASESPLASTSLCRRGGAEWARYVAKGLSGGSAEGEGQCLDTSMSVWVLPLQPHDDGGVDLGHPEQSLGSLGNVQ